jgi:hypothetical protein
MQTPAQDAGVVWAFGNARALPGTRERYLPTRGEAGISRNAAWTLAMVALQ